MVYEGVRLGSSDGIIGLINPLIDTGETRGPTLSIQVCWYVLKIFYFIDTKLIQFFWFLRSNPWCFWWGILFVYSYESCRGSIFDPQWAWFKCSHCQNLFQLVLNLLVIICNTNYSCSCIIEQLTAPTHNCPIQQPSIRYTKTESSLSRVFVCGMSQFVEDPNSCPLICHSIKT